MKKRFISVLLAVFLIACTLAQPALAAGGLSNFARVRSYTTGRFKDVATSDWYAPYVQRAYEFGLVDGRTAGAFEPSAQVTIAESIKLAAVLHSIYETGAADFPQDAAVWYGPYVDYALDHGILSAGDPDYDAPATRAEFAAILSGALPDEALAAKNRVEDGAILDVRMDFGYAGAVYRLYRAGVLTGSDGAGRFLPNNPIQRGEVAAIVTRMAAADFRRSVTLRLQLTAEEIYERCAPAVFHIRVYDIRDTYVKNGSGFFIDDSGLAVTNYHVLNGASRAVITAFDGREYDVAGICDYDEDLDLALIRVEGGGFPYLRTADSDAVATGAPAYAIGSPMGFNDTISEGIVSSARRIVEGRLYIQTTASISPGSSGGALLDGAGRVIGVTAATAAGSQNINLAVPINDVSFLDGSHFVTLRSILPDTVYYPDRFPAPDFGAFVSAPVYLEELQGDMAVYFYAVADLPVGVEEAFTGYGRLLGQNTFNLYGHAVEDGKIITYYLNSAYGQLVTFGEKVQDGVRCVRVQVMP